jgi:hypothetical protein
MLGRSLLLLLLLLVSILSELGIGRSAPDATELKSELKSEQVTTPATTSSLSKWGSDRISVSARVIIASSPVEQVISSEG